MRRSSLRHSSLRHGYEKSIDITFFITFICCQCLADFKDDISGQWVVDDDSDYTISIIYSPPSSSFIPITFIVDGYGKFNSKNYLYGKYEIFMINDTQSTGFSGTWFYPLDAQGNYMFDIYAKKIELDDLDSNEEIIINPASMTRILKLTPLEFDYEEYIPSIHSFFSYRARKVSLIF